MEKQEQRRLLRKVRKDLQADISRHERLSRQIQTHVLASSVWQASRYIVLYCAIHGEVETSLLLEQGWKQGKELFLPRCRPEEAGRMDLLACGAGTELIVSPRGIAEPPATAARLTAIQLAQSLILVPGLGFDKQGYRLGYGGGFYDRLLSQEHGPAIGLAFTCQVVEEIASEPWDCPVNALCTEEGLVWL